MKLIAVEIVGFGKWQQKKIQFLSGNQLFYGKNEAGKSTLYQFIQAMLFGFPAKGKRKKDYHPREGANYGGRLWFWHPLYGEVEVERFRSKNKGQASVRYNQNEGDEATLKQLLHPLTKELFQTVFTMQQEQLSQIDKLTEEQLQTALLSLGVSGSQQLLVSKEKYMKTAQTIYKGKGSQPPLNKKLQDYQQLQKQVYAKEQQEQQFQLLSKEIKEKEYEITEKEQLLQQNKRVLEKIERQAVHLPLLQELHQLNQQENTIELTPDEYKELTTAYQQYRFLNEEMARLNQQESNPSGVEGQSEGYPFYLDNEALIQQIVVQKYTIEKLVSDAKWLTDSLKENEHELERLRNRWQWSDQQLPIIPLNEEEITSLKKKWDRNRFDLQKVETTQKLLEEDIVTSEEELTLFEKQHKEILGKQKKTYPKQLYLILGIPAVLLMGSGLVVPSPIRYLLVLLGIAIGAGTCAVYFAQKGEKNEYEKRQWQEKLSTLDQLYAQREQSQNEWRDRKNEQQQLVEFIERSAAENHLGTMNQLESWFNHRGDCERYRKLLKKKQELSQQLTKQQHKMQKYMKLTDPLSEVLPIVGSHLLQRVQLIGDFADRMEKIRFSQEYQGDTYTRQSLRELKEKQQQVVDTIAPLLYQLQIGSLSQIPKKLESYQKEVAVDQRKKEIKELLKDVFQETDDQMQIDAEKVSVTNQLHQLEYELTALRKQQQERLFEKQQMTTDGTLDEFYQQQAVLTAEIEELALDWSSDVLAGQLLMDLLTELSEQQLPSLIKKASDYLNLITAQQYPEIELSEGQLVLLRADNQRFFVHEVSTGTCDQVIMALRFAFLAVQPQQQLCPVLIDDGWLHYDSQRKKQLAQLFFQFSQLEQVICFSSDKEMVSYYKELNQPVIALEGVEE